MNTLQSNSLVAQLVKNLPTMQETRVQPLGQKIPWRRKWQPTPVFLPGESHRQRSLADYSPQGHKESHTAEWLTLLLLQKEWRWCILSAWVYSTLPLKKSVFFKRNIYFHMCACAQPCPTPCNPMDYSPPGSSVHGIPQVRILEWVAISSSMGSSWPRDQTCISWVFSIAGGFFTAWTIREALCNYKARTVSLDRKVTQLHAAQQTLFN